MSKRGKPINHSPVVHEETGVIYESYSEAAKAVGGNRWGVRYCAMKIQRQHKGQHFSYAKKKRIT